VISIIDRACFPENLASMRVQKKVGFIRTGETERFEAQLLGHILRK
jgi:RimJ/RimL family protein N-acetyltransferase